LTQLLHRRLREKNGERLVEHVLIFSCLARNRHGDLLMLVGGVLETPPWKMPQVD
jgi:hypothetical protein